jgi:hypothetical protein
MEREGDQSNGKERRREIRDTIRPRLISEPLKSKVDPDLFEPDGTPRQTLPNTRYEVIIELNLKSPRGRKAARDDIFGMLRAIMGADAESGLGRNLSDSTHPYVFATLTATQLLQLVIRDGQEATSIDREGMVGTVGSLPQPLHARRIFRSIFRIWESQKIHPLTTESIRTVKADAAHNCFGAFGKG